MDLWGALNRRITQRIPGNLARNQSAEPLASITFDDFPRTAWTQGGEVLRRHGVKATYYVVGQYAGRTVDDVEQYTVADLKEVYAAGHEIASHSFSHNRVYRLSSRRLREEEAENAQFLQSHLGDVRLSGFAYPYGEASPRTKLVFSELYPANRGIEAGLNGKWLDLAQLKAVGIEKRSWSAERVEEMVRAAAETKAWVIFFTHDISDDPTPYGATPQMLEHAIVTLKAAGIDILPMKNALARTQFTDRTPLRSEVSATGRSGRKPRPKAA